MKKLFALIFSTLFLFHLTAQSNQNIGIGNLTYFERAYPDLTFTRHFNIQEGEWIITVKVPDKPGDKEGPGKTFDFYWAKCWFNWYYRMPKILSKFISIAQTTC